MRGCAQGMLCLVALLGARMATADVPLGGFIPYVGIGLTDEYETFDSDPDGTFFIADRQPTYTGAALGPGAAAYFDVALLDTGAATHILTPTAASAAGFAIQAEGFRGTNFQTIFGASGAVNLRINDPLGVFAAGLGPDGRTGQGAALAMNTPAMRGQSSFAMLEAPVGWTLPNIVGLPMAAHYGFAIRNSEPQIFTLQGRTVRTPNIELIDLGTGAAEGITRRTNLKIRPAASFITGPVYIQSLGSGGLDFDFHDNPLSPSVLDSGAMFVETDVSHGSRSIVDKEFLFDTGADLTVVSQLTAARLGFDVLLDEPDFELEVEGAGGVTGGVPGFYVDELNIDTVGGAFTLQNVPVAVLDLPNPNDPGSVVDGILGMHLFTGRDLVIDAIPAAQQTGGGPRLYIGDSVMETHTWAHLGPGAPWASPGAWSAPGVPGIMWDARAVNPGGAAQTASVDADSTVYRLTVAGAEASAGAGSMTVQIEAARTLTTYGEALVKPGGFLRLNQGGRLDAQFVNLTGGSLVGTGEVFVGTGPLTGAVRNLSGRIAPDTLTSPVGRIEISGDLANLGDGTLAFDLAGAAAGQYDVIDVDRLAFLGGTLQVSLANFTPSVNQTFTILTTGAGVDGQFEQVMLPAGFQWLVDYQATQVVLKVTGIGSLAGDFDSNGNVNGADLAMWKAGYPTTFNGQDFLVWQRNLGAGGGVSAVPEPGTRGLGALFLTAAIGGRCARRRRE